MVRHLDKRVAAHHGLFFCSIGALCLQLAYGSGMDSEASPQRGLYALVDYTSCEQRGLDPLLVVRSVCASGVPFLQLRAKALPDQKYLDWVRSSVAACPRATSLLVNDRADLALLGGAQGVHVGQDDLPLACVQRVSPQLIVGVSTHDLGQLGSALAQAPAYVAFGPVFPTASKQNPEPVTGLTLLEQAHQLARAAAVPLVAIGGVSDATLDEVAAHCDYVAAISLLLPPSQTERPYDWITQRCAVINARLRTIAGRPASFS